MDAQISFMKILNSRGTIVDTCGTPQKYEQRRVYWSKLLGLKSKD
jgi:hypothetical protein